MPKQVFVHIGLPKTGTTYLQDLLYANREELRGLGVTVIGRHALNYEAASELAGVRPRRARKLPEGAWDEVVSRVRAARTDRALLSSERYSLCRAAGVERLASSFSDAELHVVVTVRDLVAAEPSAWQEYVKNGGTKTWPDFCAGSVADPESLRNRLRVRRVLELWPEHVPSERLHVITVPPPGNPRELIFERLCSVVGVDPGLLDTSPPERQNASLDYVATELLRRLNAREPGLSVAAQRGEIKQWLANGVLSRRPATTRPVLSGDALDLARAENAWLVEQLRNGGLDVVGDPDDLLGEVPAGPASNHVDAEELLEAALEALELMTARAHRRGRQLRRSRQQRAKGRPGRGLLRRRR